jgi:hypothetical protein
MNQLWRTLLLVLGFGALCGVGCGSDEQPCGMQLCTSDQKCCVSPGKESVCVANGQSCPQ